MEKYTVILTPFNRNTLQIDLFKESPIFDVNNFDKLIKNKVYSDITYSFFLIENSDVNSVTVYINGYEIDSSYNDGEISFYSNERIFSDFYGFVQITIDVSTSEGRKSYYSDFLSVMVKNKTITKSIKLMSEYVYNNQDKLLLDSKMHSLDNSSLRNNSPKSLEAYIRIIINIVNTYRLQYKTFLTNSKYILKSSYKIDEFEKLNYVDSKNINYIIQHPEQLQEITPGKGISLRNKNYIPNKTLVNDNVAFYDIYENRVIIGFLHTVIKSMDVILAEISNKLITLNTVENIDDGYEISAGCIYSVTRKKFENFSEEIKKLKTKLFFIYNNYRKILPVKHLDVNVLPKPTPIFMNTKHYNKVYRCIEQWFNFGIYELQRENFLLPLLANSQLYEYFILLKLYNYFDNSGFVLSSKEKFKYNQGGKNYKETLYCNTFCFDNKQLKVTLYYQPVINKELILKNGITLIRNNSIPYNKLPSNEYYYLPDYIIKIESNNKNLYIILDAKFSTIDNVKKHYYSDLVFKYIFSFTPIESNSIIAGLSAINGQLKDKFESIESIYNDNIPKSYLPFADIITFVENNSSDSLENQKRLLDRYFEKYYALLK